MTPRPPLPRLRPLDLAAACVVALVVSTLDGALGPPGVSVAFFGIFGAIVTAVSSIWRVARGAVTATLKIAIEGIRWAVNNLTRFVVAGLKKSAVFIQRSMQTFYRWLQRSFRSLVRMLDRAVTWLHGTLTRIFQPILDWIDRAKAWIRRIYDRFVRPILDLIEVSRRVLRVLAYLGVDWARALDRQLARIEQLITFPFEWVVSKLNEVVGWINRIVTVDGLLQRVILLNSLFRDYTLTTNMWWTGQQRPLTPAEEASYLARPRRQLPDQAIADLRLHFSTGTALVSPVIRETAQSISQAWRRTGQ